MDSKSSSKQSASSSKKSTPNFSNTKPESKNSTPNIKHARPETPAFAQHSPAPNPFLTPSPGIPAEKKKEKKHAASGFQRTHKQAPGSKPDGKPARPAGGVAPKKKYDKKPFNKK